MNIGISKQIAIGNDKSVIVAGMPFGKLKRESDKEWIRLMASKGSPPNQVTFNVLTPEKLESIKLTRALAVSLVMRIDFLS